MADDLQLVRDLCRDVVRRHWRAVSWIFEHCADRPDIVREYANAYVTGPGALEKFLKRLEANL